MQVKDGLDPQASSRLQLMEDVNDFAPVVRLQNFGTHCRQISSLYSWNLPLWSLSDVNRKCFPSFSDFADGSEGSVNRETCGHL